MKTSLLVGLALVAVLAGGAFVILHHQAAVPPVPAQPSPAAPAAPASAGGAPSFCLLPGPPPVPPDGRVATDTDMHLGHNVIQAFVRELEAYQACRNAQVDHARPGTTDKQKEEWIEEGNAAVDQAHAIADAFGVQLQIFHARQKSH